MRWLRRTEPLRFDATAYAGLGLSDPEARMQALERLLADWLGPQNNRDTFGVPEEDLAHLSIPDVLRRFYRFAGRWPSPWQTRAPILFEHPEEGYFYAGIASAGMATPDALRTLENGKIQLFSEQSGSWVGLTQTDGADPQVWYGSRSNQQPDLSQESLSGWIVSQALGSIAWEAANSHLCATAAEPFHSSPGRSATGCTGLTGWFGSEFRHAVLLWTGRAGPSEISGNFYMFHNSLLVHQMDTTLRFAALTPAAAVELRTHTTKREILE